MLKPAPMAHIVITEQGAKATQAAARHVTLYNPIIQIGGAAKADIHLPQSADQVAYLVKEQGDYVLVPQEKRLLLNGAKIKAPTRLQERDTLEIGAYLLVFHAGALDQVDTEPDLQMTDGALARMAQIYRPLYQLCDRLLVTTENLNAAEHLTSLTTALLEEMMTLLEATRGFVVLFDDVGGQRVAVSLPAFGHEGGSPGLSDAIIQYALSCRKPVLVSDAAGDAQFSNSQSVVNLKLLSVLCAPLVRNGETFGLIYLGSDKAAQLFDTTSLEIMTIFAAWASLLIQNADHLGGLAQSNVELRQSLEKRQFGEIIGSCDAMQKVFQTIRKCAPADVSILITGETGTGKELIAREIHERSGRALKPFIVINCGAIPENLIESELFGHVRGAFTGAVQNKIGKFQAAHQGTLFLDEIGEMPQALQVKLLRVLQEQSVTKVGDHRAETIDVRVIAATHRDLLQRVEQGDFREDLFYRLNVIQIHLPALRERGEDIVTLAHYFLNLFKQRFARQDIKGFQPALVNALRRYPWPGNIRELENRLRRAVLMCERTHLAASDLELPKEWSEPLKPLAEAAEQFKRAYIEQALQRFDGNRTQTAKVLEIDPRTIFRYMDEDAP